MHRTLPAGEERPDVCEVLGHAPMIEIRHRDTGEVLRRGLEPVTYVKMILERYDDYRSILKYAEGIVDRRSSIAEGS